MFRVKMELKQFVDVIRTCICMRRNLASVCLCVHAIIVGLGSATYTIVGVMLNAAFVVYKLLFR